MGGGGGRGAAGHLDGVVAGLGQHRSRRTARSGGRRLPGKAGADCLGGVSPAAWARGSQAHQAVRLKEPRPGAVGQYRITDGRQLQLTGWGAGAVIITNSVVKLPTIKVERVPLLCC